MKDWSSLKDDAMYTVGLERSPLRYVKLVKRKAMFYQDITRLCG